MLHGPPAFELRLKEQKCLVVVPQLTAKQRVRKIKRKNKNNNNLRTHKSFSYLGYKRDKKKLFNHLFLNKSVCLQSNLRPRPPTHYPPPPPLPLSPNHKDTSTACRRFCSLWGAAHASRERELNQTWRARKRRMKGRMIGFTWNAALVWCLLSPSSWAPWLAAGSSSHPKEFTSTQAAWECPCSSGRSVGSSPRLVWFRTPWPLKCLTIHYCTEEYTTKNHEMFLHLKLLNLRKC